MKNIKITLSYEGTAYLGWQKTPYGPSIEQALQDALETILRHKVLLQAASRTDAGVHANGQVANFKTATCIDDFKKFLRSLNGLLPNDISVLNAEHVMESFHPTIDNEGKEYHYTICNTPYQLPFHRLFSWHFPNPLDVELMRQAATLLEGYKDFSSFCNEKTSYTRSTYCKIHKIIIHQIDHHRYQIKITGTRFLYKMVRNIVGTLAYIGSGKIPLSAMEKIVNSKHRASAGITAPAHGLALYQVFYPEKIFQNNSNSIQLLESLC
jgi:tRNA pseudouridine38-40 synthase